MRLKGKILETSWNHQSDVGGSTNLIRLACVYPSYHPIHKDETLKSLCVGRLTSERSAWGWSVSWWSMLETCSQGEHGIPSTNLPRSTVETTKVEQISLMRWFLWSFTSPDDENVWSLPLQSLHHSARSEFNPRFCGSCGSFTCLLVISTSNDDLIWGFPKMGVPRNGWCMWENPIKTDDLGGPLCQETTIWLNQIMLNDVEWI